MTKFQLKLDFFTINMEIAAQTLNKTNEKQLPNYQYKVRLA